ncbi:MAG: hypothetical protein WBG19_02715 [Thermoplasmata archaeon]
MISRAARGRSGASSWTTIPLIAILLFVLTSPGLLQVHTEANSAIVPARPGPLPAQQVGSPELGTSQAHPATVNGTWTNVTGTAGVGPSPRAFQYEAYYPPSQSILLWGGYFGFGGNYEYRDMWQYSQGSWTQLSAGTGPTARVSGSMVWDAADHYLLMFGGRNNTQEFNDTWVYNQSGWKNLSASHAPSPRDGFGLVYDAAAGEVLLFGGRSGNIPPGEGVPDTFYNDTWTYHAGVWTNITASAGAPPPAAYRLDQMVYDAADGYVLLTGGIDLNQLSCGLEYGAVWMFADGHWSERAGTSPAPSAGRGSLWYDNETGRTYYYESEENLTTGCTTWSNEVWSYSGGIWHQIYPGVTPAPLPRLNAPVVDDQRNGEQLLFGGSGQVYAQYFGDAWVFNPAGNGTAYGLRFSESGLPAGTSWSVTVNGVQENSTANTLDFSETNGTYDYTVADIPGWHQASLPYHGEVTIAGGPVIETSLAFARVTYIVSFEELGLPSGTEWAVTLNGTLLSSSSSSVTAVEPNGSYSYSISSIPGWKQSTQPPTGSVLVAGSSVTEDLAYTAVTYSVTFAVSGLPTGAFWWVDIGGNVVSSSGPSLSFEEPNGTYSFTASTAGFGNVTGRVTVDGIAPAPEPVTFTASSSHPAELSPLEYALIGVVVALAAICVALVLSRRKDPGVPGSHSPPPP